MNIYIYIYIELYTHIENVFRRFIYDCMVLLLVTNKTPISEWE